MFVPCWISYYTRQLAALYTCTSLRLALVLSVTSVGWSRFKRSACLVLIPVFCIVHVVYAIIEYWRPTDWSVTKILIDCSAIQFHNKWGFNLLVLTNLFWAFPKLKLISSACYPTIGRLSKSKGDYRLWMLGPIHNTVVHLARKWQEVCSGSKAYVGVCLELDVRTSTGCNRHCCLKFHSSFALLPPCVVALLLPPSFFTHRLSDIPIGDG